jgi:hypothetical protein
MSSLADDYYRDSILQFVIFPITSLVLSKVPREKHPINPFEFKRENIKEIDKKRRTLDRSKNGVFLDAVISEFS